jgi:ATP-dependent Clp protease ATP-binding subunit ClpB
MQLEIERQAMQKETDAAARERLVALERELAELKTQSATMKAQWQQEKQALGGVGRIKQAIDQATTDAEAAARTGDLQLAAEIRYGRIPQLQRELSEAEAMVSVKDGRRRFLKEEVGDDDIADVVAKWTGIPVQRMLESERERLTKLEDELAHRVVGQRDAVAAVANAVRRSRAGLQDPNRPIGSFLFLGPTGVGKTETARALADFLFDDERAMVRLDMSEYMEKHAVARLIGAPPGYVGYDEGGQLTEAVRRRPYSVLLFDEIEKAHPDVFNVLLQLLDDGRLTDSQGRTVDFRNTVVILTSNIGSQVILERYSEDWALVETQVLAMLRQQFRPEFLNRIDDIVVFRPLGEEQIAQIVDLQLAKLDTMLLARKLSITLTPEAKKLLVGEGYDSAFGARPLKRTIQRMVQNPLALALLNGTLHDGDVVVASPGEGGTLVFTRQVADVPAMEGVSA